MADGNRGDAALAALTDVLRTYRRETFAVVAYALCVGLLALATPIAVQALVNTVAFGTLLQPLFVLSALVLIVLFAAGILKVLKSWTVELLQRRMFVHTAARLAHVLPRISPARGTSSALMHRFFDLFVVHKASAALLLGAVDAVLAAGVGLFVIAFYHPLLLAFDLALIVALSVIVFGLGRGGLETAVDESTRKYEVAGFLAELCAKPLAFRAPAGRKFAEARLDALAHGYLDARERHFRVVLRQHAGALLTQAVASAALLGIGGVLVVQRELTVGQLVAAELIVAAVLAALGDLGKHIESYYDLGASSYKLDTLLDEPGEADGVAREQLPEKGALSVVLSDANLRAGETEVLREANVSIAAGQFVQLLGAEETERSALADLLYGSVTLAHGRLTLGDVDTRNCSREALRGRIALVRGAELVPGTVYDNVTLGDPHVPPSRVRELVDGLLLGELVDRLPAAYETRIGAGGVALSQGQALRLTLARALAAEPGLVVIDTDLSGLDRSSLRALLAVLEARTATVLFVGECPLPLPAGARRLWLDQGKLLEEGVR